MLSINLNLEEIEALVLQDYFERFLFSQITNEVDKTILKWFISSAFLMDSKTSVYCKYYFSYQNLRFS